MAKDFIFQSRRGSKPRPLSEILSEYFAGNEPVARAYRSRLFKDFFPHTELGIDLKLLTRQPGRLAEGVLLDGIIARDGESHYVFVQNDPEKKRATTTRRNPVVFAGGCVNVHQLPDGTLRLEFCRPRFYPDFTFRDFCLAAAQELLTVARLLGGEEAAEA